MSGIICFGRNEKIHSFARAEISRIITRMMSYVSLADAQEALEYKDILGDILLFERDGVSATDSEIWRALKLAVEEIFDEDSRGIEVPEFPHDDISHARERFEEMYQDLLAHSPEWLC